jgi:hypothetical protein
MLVAMAITLVMMAAVVTLFANVSNSVRNRRATIEMANQVRHMRNVLQQDLQGATCPGTTWQRPDSNHGYIELIEGIHSDQDPTPLVQDLDRDGVLEAAQGEVLLEPALSPIPQNNLGADVNNDGKITPQELEQHYQDPRSLVPGALGDFDDILMLTVRNEREPFVGRMPTNVDDIESEAVDGDPKGFAGWNYESIESPLAEVIWFAIENPKDDNNQGFFGEPGMRTIYRRALLIAPWLDPYKVVDEEDDGDGMVSIDGTPVKVVPGLLRVLPSSDFGPKDLANVFAALIAFQERYDISARVEWDHDIKRWKIMANTLADLTKRENRYGHYGYLVGASGATRAYPYPMVSWGRGYDDGDLVFVIDPEMEAVASQPIQPAAGEAEAGAPASISPLTKYTVTNTGGGYPVRPFVYPESESEQPATANAILNEAGAVVRVVHGPVPLSGARRGEDIMMTGVLGFDLRVYDPGAPLYGRRDVPGANPPTPMTVLQPSDPGWDAAYSQQLGPQPNNSPFEWVGQGAYVDMGFGFEMPHPAGTSVFTTTSPSWVLPWFAEPRGLSDVFGKLLAPGYSVYDTWSFHYENNGLNEDGDTTAAGEPLIDEGTNGLDDIATYPVPGTTATVTEPRLGADDAGERETAPPYDKPLRGVQVLIRTYEMDSRAIRQVRVNQHFLPE